MLLLTFDNTIKSYLRGIAEKNLEIVEKYYEKYQKGELKENDAKKIVTDIILSQKIGKTGYVAGVNSKGILVIHPKAPGTDASGYDFMKKAISMKNGYLEYNWKNPGEPKERAKAGYMRYFQPWDIIIWVSSYKEEFSHLINPEDFEKSLLDVKIGKTGYIFIMDSKGNIIIHPFLKGKNILESGEGNDNSFAKEIVEKKNGVVRYFWKQQNESKKREKVLYYRYIESLDWIICAGTYLDELSSNVKKIITFMLLFLIIGVAVFTSMSFIIAGTVTRPIRDAINMVKYIISENDLTKKIPVTSKDEMGNLAENLNMFFDEISYILNNIKNSANKISDLIQTLSSSTQESSSTANQQAAAVKEIVSTMEDADTLAKSIDKKIMEVTVTTENAQKTVKSGFEIVKKSILKMEEIRESNTSTIEGIKYLNEKINNIWDIVNIINGIADQTKIIAFNAELEASAAGEAGKNFQIVATEIRRLADSTVNSTKEIKEKINEIQKSSDRLLLTSENGTEKIKEGNEISAKINEMFSDILNSSEASNEATQKISLSIKQQVASFEQILIALKQISEGVDNAAQATKETSGVADNLEELAILLNKLMEKYKINTDKLEVANE
ncbi:MAG TPA: methyl-accepting chemotaxis protein [Spirochaetota bacterium]|nr:methyl-accepting chemotaxis protein [Spirochaetota bacterium]HOL56140.1 methyl-accepting chemotaxis protein [Spirochaetota bacterium]HPP03993.1 methyl-accepting chemotaxis protein [Spirochaetota bacterium]